MPHEGLALTNRRFRVDCSSLQISLSDYTMSVFDIFVGGWRRTDRTAHMRSPIRAFAPRFCATSFYMRLNIQPAMWENVPSDMCAQRSLKTVWSETLLSAWRKVVSLPIQNARSEYSDQTARMRGCAGWPESSLGAHVRGYVLWRCGLYVDRVMRARLFGTCEQRRPRSACASAQSDQDLRCPPIESLGTADITKCSKVPDQTMYLHCLIWIFTVCIFTEDIFCHIFVTFCHAGPGGSVGCAWSGGRGFDPATFFRGDGSWNIFCGYTLTSADSRRAVVSSFERMSKVLVNRLED